MLLQKRKKHNLLQSQIYLINSRSQIDRFQFRELCSPLIAFTPLTASYPILSSHVCIPPNTCTAESSETASVTTTMQQENSIQRPIDEEDTLSCTLKDCKLCSKAVFGIEHCPSWYWNQNCSYLADIVLYWMMIFSQCRNLELNVFLGLMYSTPLCIAFVNPRRIRLVESISSIT